MLPAVSTPLCAAPARAGGWGFAAALGAVGLLGAALRLLAVPPLLPDLDGVNFARALTRFDLAAQAPHFPGYPVFVLLARAGRLLGLTEVWSLALPGVVLGAGGAGALGAALRRHLGGAAALAGAAVLAFAPLAVLAGGAPASDGAGVGGLALAVAALLQLQPDQRGRALLAGALAGAVLGLRPSYLVCAVAMGGVVPGPVRWRWGVGLAAGTLAWAVPLVALTGPAPFLAISRGFLAGHAGEWGGTVAVQPDLGVRLALFADNLAVVGLGLPGPKALTWARAALALLLLVVGGLAVWGARGARPSSRRVLATALALGAPYALWALLGQNLLKARHVLPLLVAVALVVAVGVAVAARGPASRVEWAFPLALAAALAAVALPLAQEQGGTASPAARLVTYVAQAVPPAGTMLFTGEEARLFEHYAPYYRAGRAPDAATLQREVRRLARAGVHVYVTSAAPGATTLVPALEPVQRFETSRQVRTHAAELTLFRLADAAEVAR